jgi:hypothetical protein
MCSRCYGNPCVCSYKIGWPVIPELPMPSEPIPAYPWVVYPVNPYAEENAALRAENEALRQRVAALEKQLGR